MMETVRERLKQLLIILLEAIEAGGGSVRVDKLRFQAGLAAAGYDEEEIAGLLDWFEDQWLSAAREDARALAGDQTRGGALRGFEPAEREVLTPEAFGYLLGLRQQGRLSAAQMESVIHYASLVSVAPLNRRDADRLLDQLFFSFPGRDAGAAPNGRTTYH